ncbi:MAG: hypothetical protein OEL78_08580 [Hyphomicrobiales bacterium]|nr:hypothetical protein [Hyphomicrobiales bacterium]
MVRVLIFVAIIFATTISTLEASEGRLPHGMKWVSPGVVRLAGYSPGGFLARYLVDLEKLKRLGVRQLQLDATCASACTVFLRLGERVCVTDRARIGFHKIVLRERTRFGRRLSPFTFADPNLNDKFLQRLPAKIRTWRGISGGLPWRMAWLEGEEAARLIGRCT